MQDLRHFADADPVSALELRDCGKDAVLRPSDSDTPCQMGADGFHPHRNSQKIIDQLAKPAIPTALEQSGSRYRCRQCEDLRFSIAVLSRRARPRGLVTR